MSCQSAKQLALAGHLAAGGCLADNQGPPAPLANLSAPGAISAQTSMHAVAKPVPPPENSVQMALGQQNFSAH
jgi:hypothetical protein